MKMAAALMTPLPYCLDPITLEAADSFKDCTESNFDEKWIPGTSAPFALASDEHVYALMPLDDDVRSTPVTELSDIPQCLHAFPPYLLAVAFRHLQTHLRLKPQNILIHSFRITACRHCPSVWKCVPLIQMILYKF